MKMIKYTWKQIKEDTDKLTLWINKYQKKNEKFTSIYGIPRGGIIPAVILSHKTSIPFTSYLTPQTRKLLIVDDISDSGHTLTNIFLKQLKPDFQWISITLWIMKETKYLPSSFCRQKNKNEWIVFPWEI